MNDDHMKSAIIAQYKASLAMLGDAVSKCTEELWLDPRHRPAFWRIAYHTLFFTDLYLCRSVKVFSPWVNHVDGYESLDPLAGIDGTACTRAALSDYREELTRHVGERIRDLDLAGSSGMPWLPFSKLELQFYNIRHILHHVGQLTVWLREELGKEVDWVGTTRPEA